MAHNDEQGHTAHLEQLAAMTRRELLAHCENIIAKTADGDGKAEDLSDFLQVNQ